MHRARSIPLWILLPNLVFAAYGLWQVSRNFMPDLFIYRAGPVLAMQGQSPYGDGLVAMVKAQYPDEQRLHANCGYFLPPGAIVMFLPLACVPWATAKLLYLVLCLVGLMFCWYGTLVAFRTATPPVLTEVPLILPTLVMVHIVTIITFDVGQTTILMAAAIIAGQLAQQAHRPWLGALLWSLAFVKPHIALPLLPLAWALSGWRRVGRIAIFVALATLIGCMLADGSPLFILNYFQHLASSHKVVEFNRVALNPQILSWNAVLVSIGGPAMDLGIVETLAGILILVAIVVIRVAVTKATPTPAWLAAVAITGGLCTSQVLVYEAFLLVIVIPHILDCFEQDHRFNAYVLSLLLIMQMLPLHMMSEYGVYHYRPWLMMSTLLWLLARPGSVGGD